MPRVHGSAAGPSNRTPALLIAYLAGSILLATPAVSQPAQVLAGRLDPGFGAGGRVLNDLPGYLSHLGLLEFYPDGTLLAGGVAESPTSSNASVMLVRLLPDGAPDPTFGTGGHVVTTIPGITVAAPLALSLQPGGVILVPVYLDHEIGFLRYLADGTLDPSFGTGGILSTASSVTLTSPSTRVQPDGRIIISDVGILVRFMSDGTLDPTFGSGGTVSVSGGADGLAVQPDGHIVRLTAGDLSRFAADGTPDAAFGGGGTVSASFPGWTSVATRIETRADGAIVIGAVLEAGTAAAFGVARFDADGTPDPSFGSGGQVITPDFGSRISPSALALQPDGGILFAGVSGFDSGAQFNNATVVVRYLPDGTLDAGFGDGGVSRVEMPGGTSPSISGARMAPDGRIVLGGYARGALARLLGGTCGDGIVEGGEECDGVGCGAGCCLVDADLDDVCDVIDACTGAEIDGTGWVIARRTNDHFRGGLNVSTTVTLPYPFAPPLDPLANGVRLLVSNAVGTPIDVAIPGGAYVKTAGLGWTVTSTATKQRWAWKDRSPDAVYRIKKVTVEHLFGSQPGLVRVKVAGRKGGYDPLSLDLPLSSTVVFDASTATGGPCGRVSFPGPSPAPACTITVRITTDAYTNVRCK